MRSQTSILPSRSLTVAIALLAATSSVAQVVGTAYIKASNPDPNDGFGTVMALDGNTMVVGAPREDSSSSGVDGNSSDNSLENSGAAYVFVWDGSTWVQQAYLKPFNPGEEDLFGSSVSISGDTIVVGAEGEDSAARAINGDSANNNASEAGAAYVFVRHGNTWSQQAYLKAANSDFDASFGKSVSISGDTIVVGASGEASNATGVNGDGNDFSAAAAGAAYVFVRDGLTWSQQAYLEASNAEAGESFGTAVSIWEDTVVVGAPFERSDATGVNGNETNNNILAAGAAYVFERTGSDWTQQAYLKASNTGFNDTFGSTVAVSYDTIAVGAPQEGSSATGSDGDQADNSAAFAGAVYTFQRTTDSWTPDAYLKASNTGASDVFGRSLALDRDFLLVGALNERSNATTINGDASDNSAISAGAAYLFARRDSTWSQDAYIKAPNSEAGDSFGAVALSDRMLAVGALGEDSSATGIGGNQSDNSALGAGAAYSFEFSVDAVITADHPAGTALVSGVSELDFGEALLGSTTNTKVVTLRNAGADAIYDLDFSFTGAAAASFLVDAAEVPRRLAPGESVAITVIFSPETSGDLAASLLVSSHYAEGTSFIIDVSGDGFLSLGLAQQAYLKASNPDNTDQFGRAVAVSGNTIVIGAPNEDGIDPGVNGDQNSDPSPFTFSGAAYVFVRTGDTWVQQAYLKASNSDNNDFFGRAVAVSGDTIVVGAPGENSIASGINGNQNDNTAQFAGAAYVFVRTGETWSQQAYLKASNTDPFDEFGTAVSISGETIVVGAPAEASIATGVDGDESDNSRSSGAAYVFVRQSDTWSQQAYLKASNAGGRFGTSVSISGDSVVVGAPFESNGGTGVNNVDSGGVFVNSSGAAYVFVRNGTAWSQQAYFKASNTGVGDQFGSAVSINNETLIVGAPFEESNATSSQGDQNDDSAPRSGAAYVFERMGETWSQAAYLKASNSMPFDEFGFSVSVFEDTIAVGAYGHDSSAANAGAAYVFFREGQSWVQRAQLRASNADSADQFGYSTSLSGGTLVVGAFNESSASSGVDMDQSNNSAPGSGAAYFFTLNPGWIRHTFSGTASGSIGGEPFSNEAFSLVAYADPNVDTDPTVSGQFGIPHFRSEVRFENFKGTGPRVVPLVPDSAPGTSSYASNSLGPATNAVTFRTGGADVFILSDPALANHTLRSELGPVHVTPATIRSEPLSTAVGELVFTMTTSADLTYQADSVGFVTGLSSRIDTDGDGLNDAAEYELRLLGFDWRSPNPNLVALVRRAQLLEQSQLNAEGFFSQSQLQALKPEAPLIARDPLDGTFTLTTGWKRSTNLTDFLDFPATDPQVTVNPEGDIEFKFTPLDDAAFFRIETD